MPDALCPHVTAITHLANRINEAIAELQLSSKRVDDTSSSLMEAHQRLAAVDAHLEDVKNELSMTMAEALGGERGQVCGGREGRCVGVCVPG